MTKATITMKTPLKPDPIHEGLTWRDMPGSGTDNKKMMFALFKRGKITKDYVQLKAKEKAALNSGQARHRRRKLGRFASEFQSPFQTED